MKHENVGTANDKDSATNSVKGEKSNAQQEKIQEEIQEKSIVKPKIDAFKRAYATGRRKTSTSRVWIKLGTGKIVINGKECGRYFVRPVLQMLINQPFERVNRTRQFDVVCTVKGGGLSGQAGAVQHGISRALFNI